MATFLIIGQDFKAETVETATNVALTFRMPWDTEQLRAAVQALGTGERLVVDGATVVKISGKTPVFF